MSRPRTPPGLAATLRDVKGRLWDVERHAGRWSPATRGLSAAELNALADRFGDTVPRDDDGARWAVCVRSTATTHIPAGTNSAPLICDLISDARPDAGDVFTAGDGNRLPVTPRTGLYVVTAHVQAFGPGAAGITADLVDDLSGRVVATGAARTVSLHGDEAPFAYIADVHLARAAVWLPAGARLIVLFSNLLGAIDLEAAVWALDVSYAAPPTYHDDGGGAT